MATSIHRVAKCIGYEGSRQLLCKDGHYAVCFLLPFIIDVPNARTLLHDIAELTSMDEKQMLKEYFPVCILIRKCIYFAVVNYHFNLNICLVHLQLCISEYASCYCYGMFKISFENYADEFITFNKTIIYGNVNNTQTGLRYQYSILIISINVINRAYLKN